MADGSGLTISKKVLVVVAVLALASLLLFLIFSAFHILLLVFASVLLAIFLCGLADLLGRFIPADQKWLVLLVLFLIAVFIAGALSLLAPHVADQLHDLREKLPESARSAGVYISQFGWGQAIMSDLPSIDDIGEQISTTGMIKQVGGMFSTTAGVVTGLLVMVLLAVYFALEPAYYISGIKRLVPINRRERAGEVMEEIRRILTWWLIGKACSMFVVGLLTWLGLTLLGIPLALTLALLAGLLSFVPNFGPIAAAIPAVLLAFVNSPKSALYVILLYLGVQFLESNIITPMIQRNTIKLPPGLTMTFQLMLGLLVGTLGLVLATPLLAVILVVVQMIYIQDLLGDGEMTTLTGTSDDS